MTATFETIRAFVVIVAMLLVIRNLSWVGLLVRVYLSEGVTGLSKEWNIPRTYPQGIVRLGTATLCLMTLAGFLLPTLDHHVFWLQAGNHPALSVVSISCLAVLLVWRWMHFAKRRPPAIASLCFAGALAVVAQFNL